jgi:hypothetical protein
VTKGLTFTYKGYKLFKLVTKTYVDLFTDSLLLFTILSVTNFDFSDDMNFTTQIAKLLLASIVAPLLTSAFMIAFTRPLVMLDVYEWKRLSDNPNIIVITFMRVITVFSFLIVPAMIVLANEHAKEERKSIKSKGEFF